MNLDQMLIDAGITPKGDAFTYAEIKALRAALVHAALERAAVECERSEMYRGSIFAARIRNLKEPK